MLNLIKPIKKITSLETNIHFLAWQLYARRRYLSAITLWKLANFFKLRPCSSLGGLTRAYYLTDQRSLALDYFQKLLAAEKLISSDWLHLKHAALLIGEDEIALQAIQDAWKSNPEDDLIFEDLLNELSRQKQAQQIVELIKVIKSWKRNVNTAALVWQAYINLEQYQNALNWLDELSDILPASVFQDLRFRTMARAIRSSVKSNDLDLALTCAKEVSVTDGNLGCFRLLAIGLNNAQRTAEASTVVTRMLEHDVPPQFIPTAIFILARSGALAEARQLVNNKINNEATRALFNVFFEQIAANHPQAEQIFNNLLKQGNFAAIQNLSAGLSNITFTESQHAKVQSPIKFNTTPLVSIILTCFNNANYLKRAVDSILAQTVQDFELFIVDDCSEDQSFRIAKQLATSDPRIKAVQNPQNCGPYFSKNRMLTEARGQFLAFHDADDISHPQRLKAQIDAITANQSRGVFASMCYHIRLCEETGQLVERGFSLLTESPISLVLPRAEFLKTFGAFDAVRAGGDSELIRRIQAYLGDNTIQLIEYPLYFASYRLDSLTTDAQIGIIADSTKSVRHIYRQETDLFHQKIKRGQASAYRFFPPREYPYLIPPELKIDFDKLQVS